MLVPTIHLNGTSKEQLFQEAWTALQASIALADAVRNITCHGRDFYPKFAGHDPASEAMKARINLINRIDVITEELARYTAAIRDGGAGA